MPNLTYLNEGIGEPCAGQMRARAEDATSSNDIEFIFEENFGAALPTGSKIVLSALVKR